MQFHDRAIIDGPARITREGYLVASARVARANNIQDYMPSEIGMTAKADGSPYRIFRPESEVFAHDAVASAAHRPITVDHPPKDVDASNWKSLAVGDTGGQAMRDGDFLQFPIMVTDQAGVTAARTTHREFSLGYSAELDMTPGKFGDREYDASMRNIRVNHLALCRDARGGPELRIVDERPAHLRDQEITVKKIMLDGLQVDLSDAAAVEVAIGKLQGSLADAKAGQTTAETALATANTSIVAKDAEIVTLKDAVEKAKVTPQQMRDAAKAYAGTVEKAKAMGITVTDAMGEAEIKKAVVAKAMGDAAKDYSDADVATAFAVLTKDAKVEAADPLRQAISGRPVTVGDAAAGIATSRAAWLAAKQTSYRGQTA